MMYWSNVTWSDDKKTFYNSETGLVVTGVNKWFNDNFVEKVDFDKIAEKVANKRGIPVEEIKREWGDKIKRGNSLHNFIEGILKGTYYKRDKYVNEFEGIILTRLNKFKEDGWKPFSVEDPISAFGLNGRTDTIFYKKMEDGTVNYLIVDWKFVSNFTEYSRFGNLLNELSSLDASHYVKYMCVGTIYKHMFYDRMYEHFPKISLDKIEPLVVNFKDANSYKDYYVNTSTKLVIDQVLYDKLHEYETSSKRVKLEDYKK